MIPSNCEHVVSLAPGIRPQGGIEFASLGTMVIPAQFSDRKAEPRHPASGLLSSSAALTDFLLKLEPKAPAFRLNLTFGSGGSYRPSTRRINVGGVWVNSDRQMYIAVHEFAHHLGHSLVQPPIHGHGPRFSCLVLDLLKRAHHLSLFSYPIWREPDLIAVTSEIRRREHAGQVDDVLGSV